MSKRRSPERRQFPWAARLLFFPCCGGPAFLTSQPLSSISDGAIAQLGERYNGIVEVTGSIPVGSTN
jgi:hypothetical protein